ncbi:hypothetical protein ACT7DP_14875 [Bacillus paranthracis]
MILKRALKWWDTVKELAGGGTTILLTTQYLEEAEQLADRIAILHGGKIITTGTLTELKEMFPPAKVELYREAAYIGRNIPCDHWQKGGDVNEKQNRGITWALNAQYYA